MAILCYRPDLHPLRGDVFRRRIWRRPKATWMTCPKCGPADGILDIGYDLDRVKAAWQARPLDERPLNHWRYEELLPLEPSAVRHDWPVGYTPIIDSERLARQLGVKQLLFKDEGRNPTASFKDRASSVGVAHALQVGAKTIACASTGNAASSLAGHAALAGLPAMIFVPQTAPEPKVAQLQVFGATVFAVKASYDAAYDLCSTGLPGVRLVQSQLRDQPGAGRRQENGRAGSRRAVVASWAACPIGLR